MFIETKENYTYFFFPEYCRTRYIACNAIQITHSSLVQNIAGYAYTQITRARMLRRISMGRNVRTNICRDILETLYIASRSFRGTTIQRRAPLPPPTHTHTTVERNAHIYMNVIEASCVTRSSLRTLCLLHA